MVRVRRRAPVVSDDDDRERLRAGFLGYPGARFRIGVPGLLTRSAFGGSTTGRWGLTSLAVVDGAVRLRERRAMTAASSEVIDRVSFETVSGVSG